MDYGQLLRNIELMKASKEGDLTTVERLWTAGADVNFANLYDKRNTPLHLAVMGAHKEVVSYLLSKGALCGAKNEVGMQPMDLIRDLEERLRKAIRELFNEYLKVEKTIKNKEGPQTSNPAETEIATYIKRKGTSAVGQFYETKLLTMVLFRLLHNDQYDRFYLGNNLDAAGAFDDIVVRARVGGTEQLYCLQAKHKEKYKKVETKSFFTSGGDKGDFNLYKYFDSFLQVRYMIQPDKGNVMFKGTYEETDLEIIIYTSAEIIIEKEANRKHTNCSDIFQTNYDSKIIQATCDQQKFNSFVLRSKNWHKKAPAGLDPELSDDLHVKIVEDFFSRLRIFSEQATEDELEAIITKDLRNNGYENEDLIYLKSLATIEEWWKQCNEHVPYQTEKNNIFKMAENVVRLEKAHTINLSKINSSSVRFSREESEHSPEWATLLQNCMESESQIRVNITSKTPELACIKLVQLLQSLDCDFKFFILDCAEACHMLQILPNTCPKSLVVAYLPENSRQTEEIARELAAMQRLIVVTEKLFDKAMGSMSDQISGLSDLQVECQEKILETKVTFQDQTMSLGELVADAPKDLVDAETIQQLIRGKDLAISGIRLSTDQTESFEYYIDRELQNSQQKESTLNLISGSDEKVVVVAAEPGMGKSTLLIGLVDILKQNNRLSWVVRINLLEYSNILNEWKKANITLGEDEVFDLLFKAMICEKKDNSTDYQSFEINLFSFYRDNCKLILLIDGFDEVSPDYTQQVLQLLKLYKNRYAAQLWVTTRTGEVQKQLEESLNVPAYSLKPLTKQQTRDFLWKFWQTKQNYDKNPQERFDTYVDQLLRHLSNTLVDGKFELIGVPLTVKMIAKIFEQNFTTYYRASGSKPHFEQLAMVSLYEKFIELKFNRLVEEKNKIDLSKPINAQQVRAYFVQFQTKHQLAAIFALFDQSFAAKLLSATETILVTGFLEEVKNSVEKTGIISRVVGRKPIFTHQTYAEFFAALYLWEKYCTLQNGEFDQFISYVTNVLLSDRKVQIAKFLQDIARQKLANCPNATSKAGTLLDKLLQADSERNLYDKVRQYLLGIVECSVKLNSESYTKFQQYINGKPKTYRDNLLLISSQCGYIGLIRGLIEEKSAASANDTINALYVAAQNDHPEIIELLAMKGVDVNCTSANYTGTPVYEATRSQAANAVKTLLDLGANPNQGNSNDYMPLHRAALEDQPEIVKLLVHHGANPNCATKDDGRTPLHEATRYGAVKALATLLEAGAIANSTTFDGYTPLHMAAQKDSPEMITQLVSKGAAINTQAKGQTPLFNAAWIGASKAASALVSLKADVNLGESSAALTPLHCAAQKNFDAIVELLCQAGAEVNCRTSNHGRTPLHEAAIRGHLASAKVLLDHGADVNVQTSLNAATPLGLASGKGFGEMVKLLTERGAH